MTHGSASSDIDDGHGRTVAMLRDILDGERYEVVANRQGISRSAVERRIKALAVRLTHEVGVEGLKESGAAFVKRLRMHREAILQALEHFDPAQGSSQREARVLNPDEVDLGSASRT